MVDVLDYETVVYEFEHQWRYYVHFQTKNFGKGMKPTILQLEVK